MTRSVKINQTNYVSTTLALHLDEVSSLLVMFVFHTNNFKKLGSLSNSSGSN